MWQTNVCITFDEVKIMNCSVYDKHCGSIIGFTDLGDVNDAIDRFHELQIQDKYVNVATSMLVFMVRGLFIKLTFPYAQFPCQSLSSGILYPIVLEVVRNLELTGFRVLARTADGASCNSTFFLMHGTEKGLVHEVKNLYADDNRFIYFFSDVPQLKRHETVWQTVMLIRGPDTYG